MRKVLIYQLLLLLGSGKTAVLVERIINKIIVEKIDIDKIRTYTLGTTTSEGKFITNNVFTEEIDMRKYKNNIKPLGYKEDDKDV